MIDLAILTVPPEKVSEFKEIAAKPQNFYTGYFRQFITPDREIYTIDTRYDDDLIRVGLLETDA